VVRLHGQRWKMGAACMSAHKWVTTLCCTVSASSVRIQEHMVFCLLLLCRSWCFTRGPMDRAHPVQKLTILATGMRFGRGDLTLRPFLSIPLALVSRGQLSAWLAASSRCTPLSSVERASWTLVPICFRQLWSPVASFSDPISQMLDNIFEQFFFHPPLLGITQDLC